MEARKAVIYDPRAHPRQHGYGLLPLIAARENVLNAGVDLNGFQPVPFDELLANNIRFKEDHPA